MGGPRCQCLLGSPVCVPRGQEQQEGLGALFPGNVGLRRGSWCGLGVPTTRVSGPCPVLSRTAVDHPCLVGLMGSVLCWERGVASHPISVSQGGWLWYSLRPLSCPRLCVFPQRTLAERLLCRQGHSAPACFGIPSLRSGVRCWEHRPLGATGCRGLSWARSQSCINSPHLAKQDKMTVT